MDIPDANPNAMELADSFGMEPVKKPCACTPAILLRCPFQASTA